MPGRRARQRSWKRFRFRPLPLRESLDPGRARPVKKYLPPRLHPPLAFSTIDEASLAEIAVAENIYSAHTTRVRPPFLDVTLLPAS